MTFFFKKYLACTNVTTDNIFLACIGISSQFSPTTLGFNKNYVFAAPKHRSIETQ